MLVSGLWHGAAMTYVIWGGLHGIYQVMGGVLKPFRDKINKLFALKPDSLGHKLVCGLFTFAIVDFAWIFFRAKSLEDAKTVITSIIHLDGISNLWGEEIYQLGLNQKNFVVMLIAIFILLLADLAKYKGIQTTIRLYAEGLNSYASASVEAFCAPGPANQ